MNVNLVALAIGLYIIFSFSFKFYHLQSLDFDHDTKNSLMMEVLKVNDYVLFVLLVILIARMNNKKSPLMLLLIVVLAHQVHSMWYLSNPTKHKQHTDLVRAGFLTALLSFETILALIAKDIQINKNFI